MSDNIPPMEMQEEIMKRLPIKSLLQFRSVSKPWKSLIDSPKFINNHTNHNPPHHHHDHHLLVRYKVNSERKYISIIDDKNNGSNNDNDSDSFPRQQFSVTTPRTISLLRHALVLGSSDNGLLCFYGLYRDTDYETKMAVLWNPSIRKSVGIPVPNLLYMPAGYTAVGFGVCPHNNDPKIVKITHINTSATTSEFGISSNNNLTNNHIPWEVEVFTLSSGLWRSIVVDTARKSIALTLNQVVVDGVIYWHAFDMNDGSCNLIVAFDLTSEEFREVCIPDSFVHSENLSVCKLSDESLGVLQRFEEVEIPFCVVWMMVPGVRDTFKKLFTIEAPNTSVFFILEFRKNGDPIMLTIRDYEESSTLQVYEHNSGRFKDLGIYGNDGSVSSCSVTSYRETLLLLDKPDAIIQSSQ